MGYINLSFAQATLTDAGTSTQTSTATFEDTYQGLINFAITANEVSGTLDGDTQLQGSLDGTNYVNIGSTVAIADATTTNVATTTGYLDYKHYRIVTTGVGTQSTTLDVVVTAKFR